MCDEQYVLGTSVSASASANMRLSVSECSEWGRASACVSESVCECELVRVCARLCFGGYV